MKSEPTELDTKVISSRLYPDAHPVPSPRNDMQLARKIYVQIWPKLSASNSDIDVDRKSLT